MSSVLTNLQKIDSNVSKHNTCSSNKKTSKHIFFEDRLKFIIKFFFFFNLHKIVAQQKYIVQNYYNFNIHSRTQKPSKSSVDFFFF